MMKIDAEAPHSFAANITVRIHHTKQPCGLIGRKERRIKKLGYQIHLMSVGQIKRHLHIFIGIFHDDDPVVINVSVLPFALEKDGATFLHFSGTQVSGFER